MLNRYVDRYLCENIRYTVVQVCMCIGHVYNFLINNNMNNRKKFFYNKRFSFCFSTEEESG